MYNCVINEIEMHIYLLNIPINIIKTVLLIKITYVSVPFDLK